MSEKVTNDELLTMWTEFKTFVESLEQDVTKNASGNAAAGVRARKGFRLLRKKLADVTKCSLGKKD